MSFYVRSAYAVCYVVAVHFPSEFRRQCVCVCVVLHNTSWGNVWGIVMVVLDIGHTQDKQMKHDV